MFNPRQIKEIIKDNNLHIKKDFGQNFLIDKNIRDKFLKFCDIKKDDIVLEIGPGLGALTEAIPELCKRLIVIEKDKGLSAFLKDSLKKNFEVINKDILKYDIISLFQKHRKKLKIIGNLPYYITSPIIFYLLEHKDCIDSIFITMQKEVAERITAKPGSKDYGASSCSIQYHCNPEKLLRISKSCFYPQPEVDTSLLRLNILKNPPVKVKDEELLFKLIKAAFNQRRKTLFNALSNSKTLKIDKNCLKASFSKLDLDLNIRGEALSLEDFACLSNTLWGRVPRGVRSLPVRVQA